MTYSSPTRRSSELCVGGAGGRARAQAYAMHRWRTGQARACHTGFTHLQERSDIATHTAVVRSEIVIPAKRAPLYAIGGSASRDPWQRRDTRPRNFDLRRWRRSAAEAAMLIDAAWPVVCHADVERAIGRLARIWT